MKPTTEILDEWQKVCDGAEPGPWKNDLGNWQIETFKDRKQICDYHLPPDQNYWPEKDGWATGDFIALSRSAMPALIKCMHLFMSHQTYSLSKCSGDIEKILNTAVNGGSDEG